MILRNCEEAFNHYKSVFGGEFITMDRFSDMPPQEGMELSAADTKEQADHFFNSLSEGGKVNMPMDLTSWGSYFGMCTDKFDINWMISFGQAPKE